MMNRKVSEEGPALEYIMEFQTISSNLEWDEGAKVDLEKARREKLCFNCGKQGHQATHVK
jgi:hypothetical protein